jgi:hypothetical protein
MNNTPHPRGVYFLPFTDASGALIGVAINQAGQRIAERLIHDEGQRDAMAGILWDLLDERDPVQRLRAIS